MAQPTNNKMGKIYIASMNMRGSWGTKVDPNSTTVNVTSAQGKVSKNRRDFSPMTPIEGGYHGYWNFESRWQSGKIFEGIDEKVVKDWWKAQQAPKRRYPKGKGKRILCARFEGYEEMGDIDYITARMTVYVKEYYELIKNREMTLHWKKALEEGKNITIYDFDGPRTEDGGVTCLEVTEDVLKEKIMDTKFPFGHGYVVACAISGIDINTFCK
jgi:hypothetical protein